MWERRRTREVVRAHCRGTSASLAAVVAWVCLACVAYNTNARACMPTQHTVLHLPPHSLSPRSLRTPNPRTRLVDHCRMPVAYIAPCTSATNLRLTQTQTQKQTQRQSCTTLEEDPQPLLARQCTLLFFSCADGSRLLFQLFRRPAKQDSPRLSVGARPPCACSAV